VGDVVAERSNGGVVIRPAPFAEKVRETVDQYFRSGLPGIVKEQFFAGFFALSIGVSGITADQCCLYGTGQHHRTAVAVLLERCEQRRREAEVAFLEVPGILRTVDAREIEHEVGPGTVFVKLLRRGVDIILHNLVNIEVRETAVLAILYGVELGTEVFTHETLCSGN